MDELTPQAEIPQMTTPAELTAAPPPLPEAPKRDLRWVFVGQNGIRAGWGMLLFVLIFVARRFCWEACSSYFSIQNRCRGMRRLPPRIGLISEGLQAFCVFVATAVMALIEQRPVLAYGYQGTARAARFVFGLVWGFVAISALVFRLWKAGLLGFDGQLLHGELMWRYAAEWGVMFLIVGTL